MSLNRYLNLAILVSVAYIAAVFFMGDQIASLLKNQMPLLWGTAILTAINIGFLIYAFFWGRMLAFNAILLCFIQLAVFCQMHIQLHDILGATHYSYPSPPILSDWMKFIAAHTLRAVDLPDMIKASSISFQKISHQSTLAGIALLSMSVMAGFFTLAVIFRAVRGASQIEPVSKVMKWVWPAGLGAAILLMVLTGWRSQWGLNDWYLWPLDNILRTLDFDALQIFGWQIHTAEPDMNLSAIFFRVMIGVCAVMLTYRLYLRSMEGPVRSVEELAALCVSPECSTSDRVIAINELEQFGEFAVSAVPDLIKALAGSNKTVRDAAVSALEEIDGQWTHSEHARKAIPQLVKRLTSDDIRTRIEAAEILGEFGTAAEKAVPNLVKVLTDSDVLRSAAQTLGKIGPAAIPDLVRVLVNEDEHVRHASVRALERIDPQWQQTESAAKEITHFVKDLEKTDGPERSSAVRALGEVGPAAAPILAGLLADSDVRSLAIKALGEVGSAAEEAAVPFLINILANRDKEVRYLAVQALGKIAPEWQESENALNAVPFFMSALRGSGSDEFEAPAEALVEIGQASIQPLVEVLAEGNKEVFNTAARALKRIDPKWPESEGAVKAVPRLSGGLKNGQWYVRRVSAEVLGKIGPAAREAVPHLVKGLADSNKKSRTAMKNALDKILLKGTPHVQEEEEVTSEDRKGIIRLVKERADAGGPASTKAAEALGEIGPAAEEAVPHLVKALGDPDQTLRSEAVQALGRVDPNWQKHEATRSTIPLFVKALTGADVGFPCSMPGEALMEIGPATTRYLVEALADANKDVVNSAAQFLKEADPQWPQSQGALDAVPRVAEALGDSQWFVRRAAAEILGKIGPGAIKAVPYLVKTLADQNKEVRTVSKAALDKVTVRA
ncbi:HEAT repeat domain-containing protein [Desulfobacterales bacterium HSG2]|nr:HEAT repeat domain-containing protein [Desulfobacterales bacterium HSG2]